MKNTTQGFTLIELLIVIAIIGILAAVLIPNLLGARKRGYDAAAQGCASAIAKGQEIMLLDGKAYGGVAAAKTTVPAAGVSATPAITGATAATLEGTNTCKDLEIKQGGTAASSTGYDVLVQHPDGSTAWEVTQNGLVKAAKF